MNKTEARERLERLLAVVDELPEEAEILKKHQEIYLRQFGREKYSQYIQIPLLPGERPRPLIDWAED